MVKGDSMKKYLFPVTFSLLLGVMMAYFLISGYDKADSITVSKNAETIYYVQKGVYSNKENMTNNMKDFQHYIYNVEDNMYYTYIGISKSKKNAEKIKKFYEKKGYDTYIKEKITDNTSFLTILGQYDELLSQTSEDGTIEVICNQVLSKYEELVNNEY